jgi:hypothetical protein
MSEYHTSAGIPNTRKLNQHEAAAALCDEKHITILGCREVAAHRGALTELLSTNPDAGLFVCEAEFVYRDGPNQTVFGVPDGSTPCFILVFINDSRPARRRLQRLLKTFTGYDRPIQGPAPIIALMEPGRLALSEPMETGYAVVLESLKASAEGRAVHPGDN